MNCCVHCFADQGLQNRIEAETNGKGDCDFCESSEVSIIACEELSDIFDALFELYVNHPTAVSSLKENKAVSMHEHILRYWPGLFNPTKLKSKGVKQLINQIGRGWVGFNEPLFEQPVELQIYLNGEAEDDSYTIEWDTFASEIKGENRFFISKKLDLELLESTFARFAKTYPAGTRFYRARISDLPLSKEQLGKPPKAVTTPGRANPVGIPYLYISDQEETTLYETRISLHESISIGSFVLTAPLQIISLKNIVDFGPFEIQDKGFDIEEFMLIRPYLLKLEEELSKPVRKQDVNLDYLPTQYLCEYIKSLNFNAVEYRSAMKDGGYNLAVFNDNNLECISVEHYQIKELKYKWN
ncbi:RES family NAD+ phosphorylase [Sphingobacterium sp. SRCM116780]|uniref:RES family NAD+ phosphorylase n=1 Tax=Sphingobacterium sp. SRCM116780 TaxID=2907623 RepID=UPI001F39834D|nr:RES family NAD+ phosphorylase [Sphingobacterium sp. SRCM116780]UIR54770.1 RES family NAD+ phosphorylase [Sphingobacterium sp. SRCM116780]